MTDECLDHLFDRDSPPGSWARERKMTECMRMGKMSRDKGAAFERETVNLFRDHHLDSFRVPLSGATDFQKGDVTVNVEFRTDPLVGECKRRAKLPAIFREIGEHDFLTVREDRGESYTIIPTKFFAELLQ